MHLDHASECKGKSNKKEKKEKKKKATLLAYPVVPLYVVVNSTVEKENQWSVDLFPNNRSLEMIFY